MNSFIRSGVVVAVAVACAISAAAQAQKKVDGQGRVVQQVDTDGSRVVRAYAQDGALVKSEAGRDERVHFDKQGRARTVLPVPAKPDTEPKR